MRRGGRRAAAGRPPLTEGFTVYCQVEQRRSGLRRDVALRRGDRRLAALDQFGGDGRIGLDRGGRGATRRRPGGAFVRERPDEVTAVEDGLQGVTDQRIASQGTRPYSRGLPAKPGHGEAVGGSDTGVTQGQEVFPGQADKPLKSQKIHDGRHGNYPVFKTVVRCRLRYGVGSIPMRFRDSDKCSTCEETGGLAATFLPGTWTLLSHGDAMRPKSLLVLAAVVSSSSLLPALPMSPR